MPTVTAGADDNRSPHDSGALDAIACPRPCHANTDSNDTGNDAGTDYTRKTSTDRDTHPYAGNYANYHARANSGYTDSNAHYAGDNPSGAERDHQHQRAELCL